MKTLRHGLLSLAILAMACAIQAQTTIAAWEFSGLSNYGPSPLSATVSNPNIVVTGLTRASGVGTSGAAATDAWGGNSWNEGTDLATAITSNNFITFALTVGSGYSLSLSSIDPYNVRRSGTGPTTGQWQYSLDGTNFTNIGSAITWGSTTTATGNAQSLINLSGIAPLQSITGTTVTLRVVNYTASGSTGVWYLNNLAAAGNDLTVKGTVSAAAIPESSTYAAILGVVSLTGALIRRRRLQSAS